MIKRVILIFLLIISLLSTSCVMSDPPVGETYNRDPHTYLETNRYVSGLRKDRLQSGILHSDFLPKTIANETNVKYLFWYSCALLGNPSYAITLSVSYSDRESYLAEYERLTRLQDVSLLKERDTTVFEYNVFPDILGYIEPPLDDWREYTMEYAVADEKALTITYSELQVLEGQMCCEEIKSQLQFLYSLEQTNLGNQVPTNNDVR